MTVLAVDRWTSNADLIADVAELGYLKKEWKILDPTWGKGTFWNKWKPDYLTAHDLAIQGVDFRKMPWPDSYFDAVVFDPPYVAVGGRESTGIPEFHARYGMTDAPKSPQGVQMLINDGMDECWRVLKGRGFLLVKCQSYISSGRLWPGVFLTFNHAVDKLGMSLHDQFTMVTHPRPQPAGRRQVHSRNNASVLFVFGK